MFRFETVVTDAANTPDKTGQRDEAAKQRRWWRNESLQCDAYGLKQLASTRIGQLKHFACAHSPRQSAIASRVNNKERTVVISGLQKRGNAQQHGI